MAAKKARLHIIGEMNKTIESPRSELAEAAPRVLAIAGARRQDRRGHRARRARTST